MEFKTKHIGYSAGQASTIIELQVISDNTLITECITMPSGKVDVDFIISLRSIADELDEQNKLIARNKSL